MSVLGNALRRARLLARMGQLAQIDLLGSANEELIDALLAASDLHCVDCSAVLADLNARAALVRGILVEAAQAGKELPHESATVFKASELVCPAAVCTQATVTELRSSAELALTMAGQAAPDLDLGPLQGAIAASLPPCGGSCSLISENLLATTAAAVDTLTSRALARVLHEAKADDPAVEPGDDDDDGDPEQPSGAGAGVLLIGLGLLLALRRRRR